jgi:hypothetical protein
MPSYIRTRSEFALNSYTAGDQVGGSVATFADGGFIVVWITTDPTQDGHDQAIKAQRFDSTGSKVGSEFLVNSFASGAQFSAEVATLPNGNFVITWVTNISDDGTDGIKAQLFNASGEPIGAEFQVNLDSGFTFTSNVSALANGGFVISWDDWNGFDMKAQMFDGNGARVGGVITVNSRTSYAQEYGDIVGLAGGGFVATWRTTDTSDDGSGDAVKAQVFAASGAKVGSEFLVNTLKAGHQYSSSVEALAGGGFVVLWESWDSAQDGSSSALKGQIFSASGAKVGSEFRVNTQGLDMQRDPQAAGTPDGGFVVTWTDFSSTADGSQSSIKAQAFDSTGAKVGGEMLINTLTAGYQTVGGIETLADGRLILTWTTEGGDGDGRSIRGQILGTQLAPPLPNTAPVIISNGGGVTASLNVDEGTSAVTRVVGSDDGDPTALRYSITGGEDASAFRINALNGALEFYSTADHVEGGDNLYDVIVSVSDGQFTDSQQLSVSIAHVNYITIESDGGGDWAELLVDENTTAVTTVLAVDDDGLPLTYSISGDYVQFFTIDAQTGELSFTVAPDYETPVNRDNVFFVTVSATDGTRSDSQEIAVYINDVAEFGIVYEGGEGEHGEILVAENGTAVTTLSVIGATGPVTYEIVGGYDAAYFGIDAQTGELSFVEAPDFEASEPNYGGYYYGHGNTYNVIVRASDGSSSDEQELYVNVQNVDEAPEFHSHDGLDHVSLHVPENVVTGFDAWAEDPDYDLWSWVTYGIEGADAHLFEVDPYYGGLTLKQGFDHEAPIDADGDNVYEVSVIAYSGGLSATQSFSITVENDWEPVTITSHGDTDVATVQTPENQLAVTTFTATGDGPIYYEIAGGVDASWFAIDAYSGELSFLDAPNYEGNKKEPGHGSTGHGNSYDVIVRATNGYSYDDQRLSVRVQDVDEAPRLFSYGGEADVALFLDENVQAAATVRAFDPDRAATVTYGIAGGADAALFEVDSSTGAVRFRQSADFEAPADSDGNNVYEVAVAAYSTTMSVTQSLSITIGDVDENVAIISDGRGDSATVSAAENGTAVTTVAAESGLAVTYSIVGGADASEFTIDASTGALAFASAPNFEWTTDFDHDNVFEVTVRASNGMNSDEQHISVNLTNVDENPDFFDHETGVIATWAAENRAYVGVYQAYDIDGGPQITHSVTGGADGALFVIDPLTGILSFAGAGGPDFEAPADADGDNVYEVEITASQGAWSRARTFTVTVENENEHPRITSNGGGSSAALEMEEGQTAVTTVTSVDDGPNPVTYSITGGWSADLFAIDPATGALSFIAAPDYEAPVGESNNFYTVEVTASDGLLTTFQKVQILVRDVEEGVVIATGPALSVDENMPFVTKIAATDGDGDPITYSIVGGADASHFAIDAATGALTTLASLDYEAPADSDGDNVYEVTIRASDGQLSDERQMSITVNDVFDDIEITSFGGADSVSLTMQEGSSFQVADVDASFSSMFGARFAIAGGADASLFTIDPNDGRLSFNYPFMPNFEAPGDAGGDNVYDVVVVATMATSSDTQAFAITIADRNEGLWITSNGGGDANLTMDEGGRNVTTVTAFDMDGDVPAFSIVGGADSALFAIDSATGTLTFIAAPDYEAPNSAAGTNSYLVEVGASDGEFTGTQRIRIQIGNVNETPVITSGGGGAAVAVTVNENGLAVTSIAASDPDGNPLTYSISGGADASRFTIESWSGVLRFVQAPNFEAPGDAGGNNVYDVVVSVTDGLLTDSQAVAVTVANLAEVVTITSNGGGASGSAAVSENGTAVGTVTASNPDGGGSVTYAIAGGADAARFTIDASTGVLAFVSAPNFEAPADSGANNVYDVVVSASNGATVDTQALAVTVANVNEQMTITSNGGGASAAVSVNENATVVTTVVGSDPDGAPVTYAIVNGNDSGLFTIDSTTGVLAFRAAPNFEAPGDVGGNNVYDVLVMATDGHWSDTQTIQVTVGNVAEAPAITSNGGGVSGNVSVAENGVAVTVVAAADPEGSAVTYSIAGGADAARFTINAQTGALQFVAAPDWELPADSNQDNVYAVVVRASDGQLVDEQALNVTVANLRDGNNVTGTTGGDSISATSSNVALRTSNEEDLVYGRDGHDTVQGMGGDDEIYGEGGNDTLVGGVGADKLSGGLGKDQFTYNAVSDSTGASRDLITDFSRAQGDKISLSAVDANSLVSNNQAFTFIGTSAFSNVAGQLRYEMSGGMTTIFGDVNGDGVADLQIQLSGSIPLISSDFIL